MCNYDVCISLHVSINRYIYIHIHIIISYTCMTQNKRTPDTRSMAGKIGSLVAGGTMRYIPPVWTRGCWKPSTKISDWRINDSYFFVLAVSNFWTLEITEVYLRHT